MASQLLDSQPLLLESKLSRVSNPMSAMPIPRISSLRSRVRLLQKDGFAGCWRALVAWRPVLFAVGRLDREDVFFGDFAVFLVGIIPGSSAVYLRGL